MSQPVAPPYSLRSPLGHEPVHGSVQRVVVLPDALSGSDRLKPSRGAGHELSERLGVTSLKWNRHRTIIAHSSAPQTHTTGKS
jgi:hypothetical protein